MPTTDDRPNPKGGPRPRLLFLCQTLPYPPDGGVQIRTFNVLRLLAREFDITALCFYRWKGGAVQRDLDGSIRALRELADVEVFPIPQEHSTPRFLWDHLRSLFFRKVYTRYVYNSDAFRDRLVDVLQADKFDLVHIDSIDLAAYVPLVRDTPVVCVHHNVESSLLRRRARRERGAFRRAYIAYQADLTERQLRRWCGRFALNVAVSEQDRETLKALAPGARITVVPNGVDIEKFQPSRGRDEGLVFVGGNTWFPNRDALDYFSTEILPILRKARPDATPVRWVGRASQEDRERYQEEYGIEMTGYVDDIRPHVRDAACYVVPLRVGGGTRLKILDAWAMGKAVVSTSIGCEGLHTVHGENILIGDDPEGFASAVSRVLNDPGLRARLGSGGRATVEERYSWEVIGKSMLKGYLDLVGSKDHARAGPRSGPGREGLVEANQR